MSEEFGPNFITITDEDGNDIELEYVDALEHNGTTYMAFFPTADTEEEAESAQDFGLVILKSVVENGEVFETLPLPIMGLMSDAGFESVNETLGRMIKKAHEMGVPADIEPFITLSFLALPVIPTLRITPRGLCLLTAKGPEILQE